MFSCSIYCWFYLWFDYYCLNCLFVYGQLGGLFVQFDCKVFFLFGGIKDNDCNGVVWIVDSGYYYFVIWIFKFDVGGVGVYKFIKMCQGMVNRCKINFILFRVDNDWCYVLVFKLVGAVLLVEDYILVYLVVYLVVQVVNDVMGVMVDWYIFWVQVFLIFWCLVLVLISCFFGLVLIIVFLFGYFCIYVGFGLNEMFFGCFFVSIL